MAVYEYRCPKCRNDFELMRPMSEAEKPAKCPKCGSKAQKLISSFGSKTGDSIQAARKPFRKRPAVRASSSKAKATIQKAGKSKKSAKK
jgi:putative FmdB family regulatory protein